MSQSFLPNTDAGLLEWSRNFSAIVSSDPLSLGISVDAAAQYAAEHAAYASAYQAAAERGSRSMALVRGKNDKRAILKASARLLASIIRGQKTVSDQQKVLLGLTVRNTAPPRIPVPSDAPGVRVLGVDGRMVRVRLYDATTIGRAKPQGVKAAAVFTFTGPTPPGERSAWVFQQNTTRRTLDLQFAQDLPGGTVVWIAAAWLNPRGQAGPTSNPISTYLQFGGGMTMALALAA